VASAPMANGVCVCISWIDAPGRGVLACVRSTLALDNLHCN